MVLADELKSACPSLKLQEPLSKHTSFGIGGPAEYYADAGTLAELAGLRRIAETRRLPVFLLGAGSNLLVSDVGIRGLVIHLQGDFRRIEFNGLEVRAGAAAWMPALVKQCAERGLAGIEPLIGVPGTLGGGLVMNAGTRDGTIGDKVVSVQVMEDGGRMEELSGGQLAFGYRRSNLEGRWLTAATLRLKAEDRSSIMARVNAHLEYRARTQPLATSNCGSVFKNPPGAAAAQLIDRAGLKGAAVGGARISERHANFIINESAATSADVWNLIQRVQGRVFEASGIRLEPEVRRVGEWPSTV